MIMIIIIIIIVPTPNPRLIHRQTTNEDKQEIEIIIRLSRKEFEIKKPELEEILQFRVSIVYLYKKGNVITRAGE